MSINVKKVIRPTGKFLFDNNRFDLPTRPKAEEAILGMDEDEQIEEEKEPPPPSFSEEELRQAQKEAYEKGKIVGRKEADATIERVIAASLKAISESLPQVMEAQRAANAEMIDDGIKLGVAMVKKLLPSLLASNALDEIRGLLQDALTMAINEAKITIRVNESIAEEIGEMVEKLRKETGFDGRLIVLPDPKLTPADVRAEWGEGGAERSVERIWTEMTAVIDRYIEGSSRQEV